MKRKSVGKKQLPVFIGVIIILIAAAIIFYPQIVSVLSPSYQNQTFSDVTTVHSIKIDYPVFSNPKINGDINATVEKAIKEIKAVQPKPKDYPVDYKNELVVTYEKPFISNRYISVYFEFMTYTGGAHPNTTVITKNYEAVTGRQLRLSDFCSTDPKSIVQIKKDIQQMLEKKLISGDEPDLKDQLKWIATGVKENDLSAFTFDASSITFYFQQYEVASYADGPQTVTFPLRNNRLAVK